MDCTNRLQLSKIIYLGIFQKFRHNKQLSYNAWSKAMLLLILFRGVPDSGSESGSGRIMHYPALSGSAGFCYIRIRRSPENAGSGPIVTLSVNYWNHRYLLCRYVLFTFHCCLRNEKLICNLKDNEVWNIKLFVLLN